MNWKLPLSLLVVLALGVGGYFFLARPGSHADDDHAGPNHGHGHGHDDHDKPAEPKGPHGGRLLRDGIFSLELSIVEQGRPPEFRAWFIHGGQRLAPAAVKLTVTLQRPGDVTETFTFTPEGDYAQSSGPVLEPHSFDYTITAEYSGRTHRWAFAAPEMQTTISAAATARAGVTVEPAGPATLREPLAVYGQVKLNADKLGRAVPRFAGLVREARKSLGDPVAAGEVVAVVETNATLALIEVRAPLAGTIVERAVQPGETATEGAALYTIADLSNVWIDLGIPQRDSARVHVGQPVALHLDPADPSAATAATIAWLSPTASAAGQIFTARVVLPNPEGRWRPGLVVTADLLLAETTVPVAVKTSALQTLFDFTVVFSQHGEIYQARPLTLGRRGGGFVEVLAGLRAGERYVVENSFLIKADIGKAGAEHDH
ncbi:MAG: efflux RND transporter periplasmic adaptor subunit [Opitutaceae bacterium]